MKLFFSISALSMISLAIACGSEGDVDSNSNPDPPAAHQDNNDGSHAHGNLWNGNRPKSVGTDNGDNSRDSGNSDAGVATNSDGSVVDTDTSVATDNDGGVGDNDTGVFTDNDGGVVNNGDDASDNSDTGVVDTDTGVVDNDASDNDADSGTVDTDSGQHPSDDASTDGGNTEKDCSVPPPPPVCVYTQGYYKTHSSTWANVSLTLGCYTYTQDQLLALLNLPATGDSSVILVKQLIAALLNGGVNEPSIACTIDLAMSWLCNYNGALPYNVVNDGNATYLANQLDQWNNGYLNTPHCM